MILLVPFHIALSRTAVVLSILSKVCFVFHDSCLIARNLLNGLKTCWEVFQYITRSENRLACEAGGAGTLGEGYSKFDSGTVVRILLHAAMFLLACK